jgi:alpha-L-rhamnosidase
VKVAELQWVDAAGMREPRLCWTLDLSDPAAAGQEQTAYQVQVASSPDALEADDSDLWDSGKVASKQVAPPYGGAKLGPTTQCWWRVRVWDKTGRASGWSDAAVRYPPGFLSPAAK